MGELDRRVGQLEGDIEQLREEVNRIPVRHEPPLPPTEAAGIHKAYCKTDAPDDSTIITCYLDENDTGQEIEVHCRVYAATALAECVPELKIGKEIDVYKIGDEWWSGDPYNGYVECVEED